MAFPHFSVRLKPYIMNNLNQTIPNFHTSQLDLNGIRLYPLARKIIKFPHFSVRLKLSKNIKLAGKRVIFPHFTVRLKLGKVNPSFR